MCLLQFGLALSVLKSLQQDIFETSSSKVKSQNKIVCKESYKWKKTDLQ